MVSKEYLTALGQFIHHFSAAENMVHMGFYVAANLPQEVASIVKKDASTAAIISMIKALLSRSPLGSVERADVLKCIEQLGVISEFRNRVIHRGASASESGNLVADNLATMRSIESLELFEFSISDVKDAADDLLRITLRLMDALFPHTKRKNTAAFESALHAPWRHKRFSPRMPHQRPPEERPSRKPQRRPSQA
jgi:hypothetical protein